ncbi:MAG: hypothetical protein ABSH34_33135, partial [Verrucomicrobiota bacterium]
QHVCFTISSSQGQLPAVAPCPFQPFGMIAEVGPKDGRFNDVTDTALFCIWPQAVILKMRLLSESLH